MRGGSSAAEKSRHRTSCTSIDSQADDLAAGRSGHPRREVEPANRQLNSFAASQPRRDAPRLSRAERHRECTPSLRSVRVRGGSHSQLDRLDIALADCATVLADRGPSKGQHREAVPTLTGVREDATELPAPAPIPHRTARQRSRSGAGCRARPSVSSARYQSGENPALRTISTIRRCVVLRPETVAVQTVSTPAVSAAVIILDDSR